MKLRINLGIKCNNNCIICSAKGIIQEDCYTILRSQKYTKIDCVAFLGGEPTVHPDFFKIVNLFKTIPKIQLTTNGRMLSYYDFCKKCINSGFTDINLSLYGPRHIHDAITRVPGSFAQSLAGLYNLKQFKVNTYVNIVLTKMNIDFIAETINIANGANPNIRYFKLIFMNPLGNAKNHLSLRPSYDSVNEALSKIFRWKSRIILMDFPLCKINREWHKNMQSKADYLIVDPYKNLNDRHCKKIKLSECLSCSSNEECEGLFPEYSLDGVEAI